MAWLWWFFSGGFGWIFLWRLGDEKSMWQESTFDFVSCLLQTPIPVGVALVGPFCSMVAVHMMW